MPYRQIVYLSSATLPFSDADLVALLEDSRRRNTACGVTGLLLYDSVDILQVLEGPPDAVAATLARIGRDPRHRGLLIVHDRQTETRDFADWAMGFRPARASEIASVRGLKRLDPMFLTELAASLRDPAARVFVRQFGEAASR
ncbi:MAG: photopigment and puc expression activator [Alphaproteobacteria bacterium]|nr:photopigment and puc expression activator [Alphaproteobacteria bacterium]